MSEIRPLTAEELTEIRRTDILGDVDRRRMLATIDALQAELLSTKCDTCVFLDGDKCTLTGDGNPLGCESWHHLGEASEKAKNEALEAELLSKEAHIAELIELLEEATR